MNEKDEKESPETSKSKQRITLRLSNPPRRQHPELDKYAGYIDLGLKIELEAHAKALQEVNEMVANQIITNQWAFTQEFNNRVQFHRNRLM